MTTFQQTVYNHVKTNYPHLRPKCSKVTTNYTISVIILPRLLKALAYAVIETNVTRLFSYEDDTDHNSIPDAILHHSDPQYLQKLDAHLANPPYIYTELNHQDNYIITTAHKFTGDPTFVVKQVEHDPHTTSNPEPHPIQRL